MRGHAYPENAALGTVVDDVDDEMGEILEFLDALNDGSFDTTIPTRVPSGLRPGGNI